MLMQVSLIFALRIKQFIFVLRNLSEMANILCTSAVFFRFCELV